MKTRLTFLDNMKGIGIILVILGHISYNQGLTTWIYSFHMPLFFIISGFLFYSSSKINYIRKRMYSILIPYFFFSLLSFVYWLVIESSIRGGDNNIALTFLGIFSAQSGGNYVFNIVLWFLPCLLMTESIFYLINKYCSRSLAPIVLFISVIGYFNSILNPVRLPWGLDIAMIALSFYGIGFYASKYRSKLYTLNRLQKKQKLGLFLILLMLSICLCQMNGRVDMSSNYYGHIVLFYTSGIVGTLIIYLISISIRSKVVERSLVFLGVNSLIIMCTHEPVKRICIKVLSIIFKVDMNLIRTNYIYEILVLCLIMMFLIPVIYIINNKLPFLLGRGKGKLNLGVNKLVWKR